MTTKASFYKAGAYVRTCIQVQASSKIYFPINAHLSHNRRCQSTMIPTESTKTAKKPPPTFQEMAFRRIIVLDRAISEINAREDANPKKLKKRDQHLAEKADLEMQLSHLAQGQQGTPSSEAVNGLLVIGDETSIDSTTPLEGPTPDKGTKRRLRARKNKAHQALTPGTQCEEQILQPAPNTQKPLTDEKPLVRDPIVPPSTGSGGIPEPSVAYLERAMFAPQQATEPQHILLVLDLNGTILYRPDRRRPSNFLERQSTPLFLDYILSRFQVMVWSSARPENVRLMGNKLFPGPERQRLVAEWGRDRMGLTTEDYKKRVQVYKRLERVWAEPSIQVRHPLHTTGAMWDQSNTILIDDSLEKARSEPFNLVALPEFIGNSEPTDVLRSLGEYLDDVLMQKDVSAYMRQNPFKTSSDSLPVTSH